MPAPVEVLSSDRNCHGGHHHAELLQHKQSMGFATWLDDRQSMVGLKIILALLQNMFQVQFLLPGAPGIATRSKDATRGSWPRY